MLLTNQQKLVLETLEILGGARLYQLAAMLRPVFCLEKPDIAHTLAESAIRQMRYCNTHILQDGDLVYLPERRPRKELLEAIDVMLELSGGIPEGFCRGRPPILLRFSVQKEKVRLFSVTTNEADCSGIELHHTERIILLFDGRGEMRSLPVSNKQFYAVRQSDGTHRFLTADGQS